MMQIIEMFKEIKKSMDFEIKNSLQTFYIFGYNPIMEFQMEREVKKLVHQHMQKLYPSFPVEFLPQFRIKRESLEKVELQTQKYFNDLKGWRYIGTLSMPFEINLYDIYIRTNIGIEPFELMAKFDHNRNSVLIGGQKAAQEYELQIQTPLAYAYDYAISEGEL